MSMLLTAKRKSDGKILYFYDEESRQDYIDTYEEELTDYSFALTLPFGEKIIDVSPERAEFRNMLKLSGITIERNVLDDLYGKNANDDVDEKILEPRRQAKQTYRLKDDNSVEETDDNPLEVSIRKGKLDSVNMFKAFYEDLDDNRKEAVKNVFKEQKLDVDELDKYIDEEINMDISLYTTNFETESQFKAAEKAFKKTADYKRHKKFMDTLNKAYDAVYKIDEAEDEKKIQQKSS